MNPFDKLSFLANLKAKYHEFYSKSQFNIQAKLSAYDDIPDINLAHRGTNIYNNFARDLDENVNIGLKIDNISKLK